MTGNSQIDATIPVAGSTAGDLPLPAGFMVSYQCRDADTHWAVVLESGTGTVSVTRGDGL